MLEVGIHDNHGVTGSIGKAGGDGDLLTEVAAEEYRFETSVDCIESTDDLPGTVTGPIVDERHLPRHTGRIEHRSQLAHQFVETALFVEHRDNDRQRTLTRTSSPSGTRRIADGGVFQVRCSRLHAHERCAPSACIGERRRAGNRNDPSCFLRCQCAG